MAVLAVRGIRSHLRTVDVETHPAATLLLMELEGAGLWPYCVREMTHPEL